jgi:glycerol-3-phosphate O-acyltransferase
MESIQHYIKEGILYEPVIPNIHEWPITQLFRKKQTFVHDVIEEALVGLGKYGERQGHTTEDLIARTMYLERMRIHEDPWRVDPKDEGKFWAGIKKQLVQVEHQIENESEAEARHQRMMQQVVKRYAFEIASDFRPGSYHFAKRFLPLFFSTLLNASAGKTIKSVINHSVQLQERVHLMGEVERLRKLATQGTIILVPTHISNVDSILIGWALHALGLPAFIYGAGLNLYNNQIVAYFMNRLGAYTVDRRKRNPLYRATLDAYATIATLEGVHGIFFPGGTRSRSGSIESNLKLGLLSTTIEAQRRNFIQPLRSQSDKIFVVPLVMSYHFVLEAKSLIKQHLSRQGEEQYYIDDSESASYIRLLQFIWSTFSQSSNITLAFGKPMDVFGNFVDEDGESIDAKGRRVDRRAYFMSRGEITEDVQRDQEYTRILGERIVERYHVENHVFSSHLVAFVAFEYFKAQHRDLDLYGLLRLPEEERVLPLTAYREAVERVLARLRALSDAGKVHLASHLTNDTRTLIEHGVKNLGIYHDKRPLRWLDQDTLRSDSMNLLYYYHNRLQGYELERYL